MSVGKKDLVWEFVGHLDSFIAVFAMFASSLTVIGNALRLFKKRFD